MASNTIQMPSFGPALNRVELKYVVAEGRNLTCAQMFDSTDVFWRLCVEGRDLEPPCYQPSDKPPWKVPVNSLVR